MTSAHALVVTEQERIEGINSEQLATATDRVLLASRFGRARPSSPHARAAAFANGWRLAQSSQLAQGSQLAYLPGLAPGTRAELARGSQPRLSLYAPETDAPLYAPPPAPPSRQSSSQLELRIDARNDDLTVFTRRPKHYKPAWSRLATTALVTSLLSVATAIALLI